MRLLKRGRRVVACSVTLLISGGASALPLSDNVSETLSPKPSQHHSVESPVERYTVLAPGTGGWGAKTCNLCKKEMSLYDSIVARQQPLSQENLEDYYKVGKIGLHGPSTSHKKPKTAFPAKAWRNINAELKKRGYEKPITYVPPKKLSAQIDWDGYHVPHVVGSRIEDVTFGLGYATVRSNMFEMLLIRAIGKSGLIQTGIKVSRIDFSNPGGLFKELMSFQPLNYSQSELMDTLSPQICDQVLGEGCQEFASALVAYREGINKSLKERIPVFSVFDTLGIPWPRWQVGDSGAVALAVTGVFGDPGADQISNLEKFKQIAAVYGPDKAKAIFDDLLLRNAPLDPSTVSAKDYFSSPLYADGSADVYASGDPSASKDRPVDAASIAWVDLEDPQGAMGNDKLLNAEKPHASNWMVISKEKSATGNPLLVGGPQMGYVSPNIFMEFDIRTTDNAFQITGVSLPGLFIAAFAGSAHNGVWSPTSAGGKTSDVFVEKLCSPTGEIPVPPKSKYYMHNGECKPMRLRRNYGTPWTVHGPVTAWDTVNGEPVAISRKSYNAERMAQGVIPYFKLAKGEAKTAEDFIRYMEPLTLALNYVYINESDVAYINTGLYPVRATGAQVDFPTWGTGEWDWQGVIPMSSRPHVINPAEGYIVSWNNQAAPGFYESDGSYHRVQMLSDVIEKSSTFDLGQLAEISQTAAVQDGYSVRYVPLLKTYFDDATVFEETGLSGMMQALFSWAETGKAARVDLDDDGRYDSPGPAIMDEIMLSLRAELEEAFGIPIGSFDFPNAAGSAYVDSTSSIVLMLIKRAQENGNDLQSVNKALLNCGDGTHQSCQALVLAALVKAKATLEKEYNTNNPSGWLKTAAKIELGPLKKTTWRWQNRPTYQQAATVN